MRLFSTSHLSFLLFVLVALFQPSLGAKSAATSFCKCICFNNSTIIALNPPPPSRRASQFHSLDIRSPGDYAEVASPVPGWSHKRDTDDAEGAAAKDDPLSSPSSSSSSLTAASTTTTSTTVAVDDGDDANDHPPPPPPGRPHRNRKLSCSDCTRAFCLDYNLPICKDATEEDVFTTCFQRDSLKDETVVVVFIFATAGLLGWALVKPWIDRLRERNTFTPIPQRDTPRVNIGR
ncbi:uncharacterized protein PV06_01420 [Exophiala oligosperma]|uniref:Uncharacterized protein n=2 Tax=Chaetothyriales TaxID=34395 RepID=A0A0D2ELT9_9EURO|nr:uncharacterized protein PV06_01420 [Exophiala oligosperma]KAJ9637056.1 hypothetical protein H2204_004980 [Knufia peltigerae]KIW48859.1 hypothetical protein PV06_01420 [Exophiala oligosperma]